MILDENSGGWTATEVDASDLPDSGLIGSARSIAATEPAVTRSIASARALRSRLTESVSARLAAQVAAVICSALLVGILVFFVVRVAVADDSGSGFDDAVGDLPTVDPGPGNPDGGVDLSSRSGSRRSTSGGDRSIGDSAVLSSIDGDTDDFGPDSNLPQAQSADGGLTESDTDNDSSQQETASSTAVATSPTSTESSGASTTASTTATTSPSTVSSTAQTTTPTSASTVSTTETSTTTPSTASTQPSTTASVPLPKALIATPTGGSVKLWDTVTRFRANVVPGAASYCWSFKPGGHQTCSSGPIHDLPADPDGVQPGPVTVSAEALGDNGRVIMTQQIGIELLAANILDEPNDGDNFHKSDRLRLRSNDLRSATNYCWTLTQGGASSGQLCDPDGRITVRGDVRRLFDPGAITLRATVFRGQTLIGRQTITISFEG